MNVYYISLSEAEKLTEEYCQNNFPQRLQRAQKFLRKADRLRCIGAGALLHTVAGIREDALSAGVNGKPMVVGSSSFFNLSHSGNFAVMATDIASLGIDVEEMNEKHLFIAPKVYTPEELTWMEKDPLPRFTTLWTAKESVLKAIGSGLSVAPESFSVLPLLNNGSASLFGAMRYCKVAVLENCMVSVCTEHPIHSLRLIGCTAEKLHSCCK